MSTDAYSVYFRTYHAKKQRPITDRDEQFLIWIDQVEKSVKIATGFRLLDLPDEDYYVEFQNGTSFEKMSKIVRENYAGSILEWTIAAG